MFFEYFYSGSPFIMFGPSHFIALFVVAFFSSLICTMGIRHPEWQSPLRIGIVAILWGNELTWHIWHLAAGTWTIQEMLPFHLCTFSIWLAGFMLLKRSYRIFEFVWLFGIAGTLQALITPGIAEYGFPHFRFFEFFIGHGFLFAAALWMITVQQMKPTFESIFRVAMQAHLYLLMVFAINKAIDANYIFINEKPGTPSIMDLMPEWPYYLIHFEVIGISSALLLTLPFYISPKISDFIKKHPFTMHHHHHHHHGIPMR